MRLAYLGPEGTFTHRAALEVPASERLPRRSIRAVFEAVARGEVEAGVVPAENVLEGAVNETLDLLLAHPAVQVAGEKVLPIEHLLLGRPGREVERVYSHPQALAQCAAWLDAQLPRADRVACLSTGEGVALAAGDEQGAAIAPALRAGLEVLATGLGTADNRTRFFVLSRRAAAPTGSDRTLVAFGAPHRAGALHACLGAFADAGVNLSRIESRPSRESPWTYHFVAELEGHPAEAATARALDSLAKIATWVRSLGAWPSVARAAENHPPAL